MSPEITYEIPIGLERKKAIATPETALIMNVAIVEFDFPGAFSLMAKPVYRERE
jgi:hypothetical protein